MRQDSVFFTAALLSLRQWMEANLPLDRSALAYDLIILVVHRTMAGDPVSLKEIFNSLQYSETGIRKQLNRFLEEGQMRLETSLDDNRVRLVVAEPPLLQSLEGLIDEIKATLGPLLG